MFSWEITQLLESNNYHIDSKTYTDIVQSQQINHIKYDPHSTYLEMWDDIGTYWKFTVYRKDDKL